MAYSITTTNGNLIATVNDATINTTATALTLIGRDYAGYGAFLNENFVYLLENFASNTEPQRKLTGQLWYDTGTNTLQVWNSTLDNGLGAWKPISSSLAQPTSPAALSSSQGDLWFDTANNQLHAYNSGWQLIGPPNTSAGGTQTSGAIVESVLDSSDNSHIVIKFYVEGVVIGVISYDAAFTPKLGINGFTIINPGFNLVSSVTVAGAQLTGDASNALKLNGIGSNQFLRSDQNTSTPYRLNVGNLTIGGNTLSILANVTASEVQINSMQSGYNLNFYANVGGAARRVIGIDSSTARVTFSNSITVTETLTATGGIISSGTTTLVGVTTVQNNILPNTNGTLNVGTNSRRFAEVFANAIVGGTIDGNSITGNSLTIGDVTITAANVKISGTDLVTESWVTTYTQTQGYNSQGQKRISTSAPSGTGSNGDIWYQV